MGTARVATWNTVMLSTGESKILDLVGKSDGGAHGRVISICTPPYRKRSPKYAAKIHKIESIIKTNYGKAGVKYVRYIMRNKKLWPLWRKELQELIKQYESKAEEGIMNRLGSYFACAHLAGKLFNEALGIELDYKKHLKFVYQLVSTESKRTSDMAKEALKFVYDYCVAYPNAFYPNDDMEEGQQPYRGWLGAWKNDKELALIPSKLDKLLEDQGYDPNSIKKQWKQNKWLKVPKGKGLTLKRTVGENLIHCNVINKRALDLVLTDND